MRYARRLTLCSLAALLVYTTPLLAADRVAGRALYQQYCSVCHGAQGKGDGPAASTMQPKPRDHTDGRYMNSLHEGHLTRVISEGGTAVQRSPLMPSWKNTLTPQQIAEVIAYLRTLAVPPYTP